MKCTSMVRKKWTDVVYIPRVGAPQKNNERMPSEVMPSANVSNINHSTRTCSAESWYTHILCGDYNQLVSDGGIWMHLISLALVAGHVSSTVGSSESQIMGIQPHRSDISHRQRTSSRQYWTVPETIDSRAASPHHSPLINPFNRFRLCENAFVIATHVGRHFLKTPAFPKGAARGYIIECCGRDEFISLVSVPASLQQRCLLHNFPVSMNLSTGLPVRKVAWPRRRRSLVLIPSLSR